MEDASTLQFQLSMDHSELGGHPVLRHDYVTRPGGFPFEFTMYVYKQPYSPDR